MTLSKTRWEARKNLPCRSSGVCLRILAHIIGVSVSDTTAEIRMVTPSVTANSLNSRPTTSRIKRRGMSTAIRETVSDKMVKPICLEPLRAASRGGSPCSTYLAMFSIMTMASSTTNPVEMVRAIKERLLRLNPNKYITPKVPTRDRGTATLGMTVAAMLRRKINMTSTTKTTASINSNCTSLTEARMVVVRSVNTDTLMDGGKEL